MVSKKDIAPKGDTEHVRIALSSKPTFKSFTVWLVGDTPLITHAWSEKARREMLLKQVKGTKGGKEARDPETDFVNSLYDMGEGAYGFPAMGFKNCVLSAAHKDKGIPRSMVMSALWIDADMVRARPALAGAICDMPLLRIYGSKPEMREDMVKVGSGLNKTATLAYRGQFTVGHPHLWALQCLCPHAGSAGLPDSGSGMAYGLGEWRNERKGMFGAFHLADADEEAAWEAFAAGTGVMPVSASYAMAAE